MSSHTVRQSAPTTTLEQQAVLRARELIADFDHWTIFHFAERQRNRSCTPFAGSAIRFCHNGAIMRALWEIVGDKKKAVDVLEAIKDKQKVTLTNHQDPFQVNDELGRTLEGHRRVLKLLDDTAKLLAA